VARIFPVCPSEFEVKTVLHRPKPTPQGRLSEIMASVMMKETFKALRSASSTLGRQSLMSWCPSSPAAISRMAFHACPPASSLASAVSEELKYESEASAAQDDGESALKSAPAGWEIQYKSGEASVKLTKSTGSEKVVIHVSTLSQEEPYDENPEEPAFPVSFTVDSVKGEIALRFDCVYVENDEADPSIREVSLVPSDEKKEELLDFNTYDGPRYSELDEKLQTEFAKYLKERGVDADMGQYLCRLVYDKEQECYVDWLKRLKQFTSS
jgi:hypothetical protein